MSVFEYIEERKRELDSFAEMWETARLEGADYPEDLEEEEWYEQELAYNEMENM